MKSKAACWIAIWSSKTLENKKNGDIVRLNNEYIPISIEKDGFKIKLLLDYFTSNYKDWEIQVKPDWREGLNDKRTLCKVWDDTDGYSNREITAYKKGNKYPFVDSAGIAWKNCRRLIKSEIQELMDAAPEKEDED